MSRAGPAQLLTLRKTALRLRIAQRRARLQAECDQLAQPLHRADAWLGRLRRLRFLWPVLQALGRGVRGGGTEGARPPFAGVRRLARWAPLVLKIFRAVRPPPATYAGRAE